MLDAQFVEKIQELYAMGDAGKVEMRDLLRNGNLTRLIELAAIGAGLKKRRQPEKIKSRLPEGFPGPEEKGKAIAYWERKRRPDLVARVGEEAEKFAAYHESNGTRSESWAASWRTWYSSAIEFNKPPREGGLFAVEPLFEQTNPVGWASRLDAFYTAGTWIAKWAGKPPALPTDPIPEGCKCPKQAFTLYLQNQQRRA